MVLEIVLGNVPTGGSVARGRLGRPGCFPSQPAGSPGLGEGIQFGRLQSPPLEPFAAAAGEGPTASSRGNLEHGVTEDRVVLLRPWLLNTELDLNL